MSARSRKRTEAERDLEIRFLESVLERCPGHVEVMKALGDLYTRAGRVQEGLKIDLQLVRLCPRDDMVWYNLGCSYALSGQGDSAFDALGRAVDLGYSNVDWMREDEDLVSIREDPRFATLVERASSIEGTS